MQMVLIFLLFRHKTKEGKDSPHKKGGGSSCTLQRSGEGPVRFSVLNDVLSLHTRISTETFRDRFLKHDERSEMSQKMDYFLFSYIQPNSGARDVVFRVQI